MKLTNYMRDAFIRSVMQDVPHPDYKAMCDEAQEALVKAMSPKVRAAYRENPKALATTYTNVGRECRTLYHGGVDYNEVLAPFYEKASARYEAEKKLKSVVYGCSTVKQLRDAFPEFGKHLPSDNKPVTANLPAVSGVVAQLVSLGMKLEEKTQ